MPAALAGYVGGRLRPDWFRDDEADETEPEVEEVETEELEAEEDAATLRAKNALEISRDS